MHHEHGSVCMENTTYQWIHEWQTFVGSSVSSMRTFSVSEQPECEVSGLHVWCVYADNTDVVQRRTSFCCFGSCYILGENSWRAQTSFCCHTWTRLDLHLCCPRCVLLFSSVPVSKWSLLSTTFLSGSLQDWYSESSWTSHSVKPLPQAVFSQTTVTAANSEPLCEVKDPRLDQRYLIMLLLVQPKNVQRLASEQRQTYLIRYVQRWVISS